MPVRKIPKNYTTVTGLASSPKSEELVGYEGRLEFYCIKVVSFNRNVVSCEEQPVKIRFQDGAGKNRTYTPDLLITFKKQLHPPELWKPLLVEVKPRRRLFKNLSEFRPKFRAARRHVEERGQDFTIITDREIVGPYLRSVLFLLKFRAFPVDPDATALLVGTIRELGTTTPHNLILKVADTETRRGELLPTLWQLVANFSIGANLEERLTMQSPIWGPEESAAGTQEVEIVRERIHRNRWRALRCTGPFLDCRRQEP